MNQSDCYWDELYLIAGDLKRTDTGFWSTFVELPALVAWLHYRGKCGYCNSELVQKGQLVGGAATTDHLLSSAKSKIGFTSHWNAVPTCASCNSIKGIWDRRDKTVEYPEELTEELHEQLVKEASEFIRARRGEADARFASEQANWVKALERRNALDWEHRETS
jgi:5-methylcytosine-specific restriction endonuclease McrA